MHLEAVKFAREGYTIVLIGHKNHDEVIGTLGEAPAKMILVESVEDVDALNIEDPSRVAYLTQTTLSLDETKDIMARLEERFPMIRGPEIPGHLLRDRKPPDGGQGRGGVLRFVAGGGLGQQFEFEAAGRSGTELRCAGFSGE